MRMDGCGSSLISISAKDRMLSKSVLWSVDPDPHHLGNLDPHPDRHLHQIKILIRIRIKIYKLDPEPDPHQFAVKPKCMEYDPI
jgi:hypothetical protein